MDELFHSVERQVLGRMDFSREIEDLEIKNLISAVLREETKDAVLGLTEREEIAKRVFDSLRGFDAIQELLDDDSITEIMVNGPKHIYYEKDGQIYQWKKQFSSEERLEDIIQRIVGMHNRVVNLSSPIVDTRLMDGSRVNIVLSPIAIDGSTMTIRKFSKTPFTLARLIELQAISAEAARFLELAVGAKYSILVSGGTGSGKTTFLNALSGCIPKHERIITIEDSAELQITGVENLVRLETRGAGTEGLEEISIRRLIKTALRMRPNRIIVGECRGAEAFDMLQTMNTGHDGSMSTLHSNSCRDSLSRLEMMIRMGIELPLGAIRAQIVSGVDLIVHLGRMPDKSRKVIEIVEITELREGEIVLNPLYRREGDELVRVGELESTWKMEDYEASLRQS